MNDLLKGSFELPRGQSSREGDVELGEQQGAADQGLDDFFKKAAHEESKAVTKAPAMKEQLLQVSEYNYWYVSGIYW
ncbi:unnamed protein product [Brassica napus]|uniref:(rape) hypothetical protein n=1 Tax=Brassica napus TaxID=3708 RepID=A0A816VE41_BRANA|nr:unnamed protein product [Brassica napus]